MSRLLEIIPEHLHNDFLMFEKNLNEQLREKFLFKFNDEQTRREISYFINQSILEFVDKDDRYSDYKNDMILELIDNLSIE